MTTGPSQHRAEHSSAARRSLFEPAAADLIRVGSRRWFIRCGLAGMASLSAGGLLRRSAQAAEGKPSAKSVILFWLSGGPSHLDFWDPKPDAPAEIRGPFGTIATKVPGLRFCEQLPLLAGSPIGWRSSARWTAAPATTIGQP